MPDSLEGDFKYLGVHVSNMKITVPYGLYGGINELVAVTKHYCESSLVYLYRINV